MTQKQIDLSNKIILALLIVLVFVIWNTASVVFSIVFAVLLLIGGLNITGVTASLFGENKDLYDGV